MNTSFLEALQSDHYIIKFIIIGFLTAETSLESSLYLLKVTQL